MGWFREHRAAWQRRRRIRLELLTIDPSCWYCGRELEAGNSTLDHFRPRSAGGGEELANLLLACVRCNKRKGDFPPEFLACYRKRGRGLVRVTDLRNMRRRALKLRPPAGI